MSWIGLHKFADLIIGISQNCVILHDHLLMNDMQNSVQLQLHAPTLNNIYLGVLSSHMQYIEESIALLRFNKCVQSSSLRGILQ